MNVRIPIVRIGGVPIAAITFEEALALFLSAPAARHRLRAHFCTAHTIVEANQDPLLMSALQGGFAVADGMPLAWTGRARGYAIGRVCGPDILPALVDRGRSQGARHYFYGGAEGVAERLADRLTTMFPGVNVVGVESPPFRALRGDEDEAMVERLNAAHPDYVWVGLGTPKQDHWLAGHRTRLEAPVLFAVGAAFDIVSGDRPRAPLALQRAGMEWAFRFAQEPRRLGRRYTIVNIEFLRVVAKDLGRRTPVARQ